MESHLAKVDYMNDWPHKRDASKPVNVLLMAIPSPDPTRGIYFKSICEYVIDSEKGWFPSELVFGFYSPPNGEITMREDLEPNNELREKYFKIVKDKFDEQLAIDRSYFVNLGKSTISSTNQEQPKLPLLPLDPNAPDIGKH